MRHIVNKLTFLSATIPILVKYYKMRGATMKHYLSFDIGGTQIKFAVMTERGDIIEKNKIDTAVRGEQIISDIVALKEQLQKKYSLQGAAFSLPGFVNVDTGFLKTAGAITDFFAINFKEIMTEKLGLAVELENDVNCVALAEKWLGNAQDSDNFICITIGTGIGGAIFVNGQLVRGHSYMAGEFGYMLSDNLFNSKAATATTFSHCASVRDGLIAQYCQQEQQPLGNVTGHDVYRLAQQGDQVALQTIDTFYQNIAIGLYNLTFTLNPEKILIGGAISAREEIFPAVKGKFQEIINANPALKNFSVEDFVTIDSTYFKNDSGLIGALYHFLQISKLP